MNNNLAKQGDCNDINKNIYPGAFDNCGDGIDQDCSGSDQLCSSDIDNDELVDCFDPDCDRNKACR